jgi:formylglycine-generating enzyme required for sulfatase activity
LDLGNGQQLKLVLIPAGKFTMGTPETEFTRKPCDGPQHEVTISRPFYMGIYHVTQAQYEAILGPKPAINAGWHKNVPVGPDFPVHPMSYEAIRVFCDKLSGKSGRTVRLPTEAEWEYACRAGTTTAFFWGDDHDGGSAYGCFSKEDAALPMPPVGQKKPNPWGLYDMLGYRSQVCIDQCAHYPKPNDPYPSKDAVVDPINNDGDFNIVRGGFRGWYGHSRCGARGGSFARPEALDHIFGFRVVVEASAMAPAAAR